MHLIAKVQRLRNVKTFTVWLKQTKRSLTTAGNPGRNKWTGVVIGLFSKGESFAEAAMFESEVFPVDGTVIEDSRILVIPAGSFRRRLAERPAARGSPARRPPRSP